MKSDTCIWEREEYRYSTDCGYTHNPHVKNSSIYKKVVDNVCPYCGKPIEYSSECENYNE